MDENILAQILLGQLGGLRGGGLANNSLNGVLGSSTSAFDPFTMGAIAMANGGARFRFEGLEYIDGSERLPFYLEDGTALFDPIDPSMIGSNRGVFRHEARIPVLPNYAVVGGLPIG